MFDESVSKRARVKEVERTARQLADSVSKLFSMDDDDGRESSHDCEYCGHGKFKEKKEAWKAEAKRKWDHTKQMASERGHQVDEYAHENVWKTVGIAAAVGAVVGSLLMKRRR